MPSGLAANLSTPTADCPDRRKHAIDRRAALRGPEPAEGSGVLHRRSHRGTPERARQDRRVARGLSHISVQLQRYERGYPDRRAKTRSEEHTSELQSLTNLVC